jgi:hypothetical protein
MVRAAKRKQPAILFLGSLLLIGGLTLGSGVMALLGLAQTYRPEDLAYSESDQTFRLWFLEARRHAPSDDTLTTAVAERLRAMRIDKRRALVDAMMSNRFLATMWSDEQDRRGNLRALLGGALQALSSSPMEGDLWLIAARLRWRLEGFDDVAEQYLDASFRYTPREIQLLVDRLVLARAVGIVLSPETRQLARRDQDYLRDFNGHGRVKDAQEELRSADFSTE